MSVLQMWKVHGMCVSVSAVKSQTASVCFGSYVVRTCPARAALNLLSTRLATAPSLACSHFCVFFALAMASSSTFPVEVWMHIARELAVPTVDVPWPRDLAALAQVARQVRPVALSLLLSRLHFVNPSKGSKFPLAAWVEHVATLLDTGDKTLRNAVRTVIVDSREHQDSMQLRYIDFLVAVQPLGRIIRDARRIKRLTLRRVSVTPDIHAALYRLHGLRRLEIEYSYLAPSPSDRPRHKLKELKTVSTGSPRSDIELPQHYDEQAHFD